MKKTESNLAVYRFAKFFSTPIVCVRYLLTYSSEMTSPRKRWSFRMLVYLLS